MNTIRTFDIDNPFGEHDRCAKFIVDDVTDPFVLYDIARTDQEYTLSFWIKSDASGVMKVNSTNYSTTPVWKKQVLTFTASDVDLAITFLTEGTYYIYHPQLEIGNKATDWVAAPEDVEQSLNDSTTEIKQIISEQSTDIIKTCESIILNALDSYTETGDFETFRKTTEAQLTLMSQQMELKFTQTTSDLKSINEDLQSKFNTITKYFTFDINGLTIGQSESPYKVIIDNDRYSMTVNDREVMWISDGKVYTPEIEVTRAFKLFGYMIEQDAAGNVNCGYVGGEM